MNRMSIRESYSLLLLIVALQLVVTTSDVSSDQSTTTRVSIDDQLAEDEEDTVARKSTTLCINVAGCNCDDDQREANCNCRNLNSTKGSQIKFSNFLIPPTIETIRISDCGRVKLNHPELLELHLKELTIKSAETVMLESETLGRVDKLVIENVKEFELEQFALDSLESNSVQIVNTTFSSMSAKEIKPKLVKEELVLLRSTLPTEFRIHLTESRIKQQQTAPPSLVIKDCLINAGLQMEVNVSHLQMINNRFQILPVKHSLNIHYTNYVSLIGNTLVDGGRGLPDVNKNQTIGEMKKNDTLLLRLQDKDATTFWDAFHFHFTGKKGEKKVDKIIKTNDANSPLCIVTLTLLMAVAALLIQ